MLSLSALQTPLLWIDWAVSTPQHFRDMNGCNVSPETQLKLHDVDQQLIN
jgi:hypothetical protein